MSSLQETGAIMQQGEAYDKAFWKPVIAAGTAYVWDESGAISPSFQRAARTLRETILGAPRAPGDQISDAVTQIVQANSNQGNGPG